MNTSPNGRNKLSLREVRVFSVISKEGQNALTTRYMKNAHCEENEMAVIGAALQDKKALQTASSMLSYTDFANLYRGAIWYCIQQLSDRGENVDILSIVNVSRTEDKIAKQIKDYDIASHLSACIAACPDPSSVHAYVLQVIDFATRWRLASRLAQQVELLSTNTAKLPEILDEITSDVLDATKSIWSPRSDAMHTMLALYEKVEHMYGEGLDPTIHTGFHDLDEKTGGLFPKNVTVLVGEAGRGKTTWSLSATRQMVKQGYHVAYFSLEMNQEEIARILTAMEVGISRTKLRTGRLTEDDYARFVQISGNISKWSFDVVDDLVSMTPAQMVRRLRLMMLEKEVDVVIVDNLRLMEADKPTGERHRDVAQIMYDMTTYANELDIPILLVHHYKNALGNRKPEMGDISESTGVEKTAQTIWALFHMEVDGEVKTYTRVLKDRNGGSTGETSEYFYNREYSRYEGAGVQHVSESIHPD